MRRTGLASASLSLAAVLGGLLAPAHGADAEPVLVEHLVGTSSCLGAGSIRFAVDGDESGALWGDAVVTGIRNGPWWGSVTLVMTVPADLPAGTYDSTEMPPTKRYVVHEGRITASASAPATPPAGQVYVLDASAAFDRSPHDDCTVRLVESRGRYHVIGSGGNLSISPHRSTVRVDLRDVSAGHRYREVIRVARRDGGVADRTIERTATTSGFYGGVDLSARGVPLASFRRVSVRIVDLTDRSTDPIMISIAR